MATPQQKLADALDTLRTLQDRNLVAIRSDDLSRPQRELLMKQGFLQEVMKGWYIPARPDAAAGESTAWYTSYWGFCSAYLNERFGEDWSLSPELSIALQTGNRTVPKQLLVRTPKGGNKPTALPLGTSLFDVRAAIPAPEAAVAGLSGAGCLLHAANDSIETATSAAVTVLRMITPLRFPAELLGRRFGRRVHQGCKRWWACRPGR